MTNGSKVRVKPFFLDAAPSTRFCLLHEPPVGVRCSNALLYVHPFAEEMNKTRRMTALQSRRLAEAGCTVLQMDLYGCGDSDGDFSDARWEIWKQDVALGVSWLKEAGPAPITLWGLRLGASLALECAAEAGDRSGPLLLWQPIVSGEAYLTQFLRQRVANEMVRGEGRRNGTNELRERMRDGEPIEVSGYTLAPSLAMAIDRVKLSESSIAGVRVCWFEVLGAMAEAPSPAVLRTRDELVRRGTEVALHTVRGEPFWTTVEITECPDLLEATLDAVTKCR